MKRHVAVYVRYNTSQERVFVLLARHAMQLLDTPARRTKRCLAHLQCVQCTGAVVRQWATTSHREDSRRSDTVSICPGRFPDIKRICSCRDRNDQQIAKPLG